MTWLLVVLILSVGGLLYSAPKAWKEIRDVVRHRRVARELAAGAQSARVDLSEASCGTYARAAGRWPAHVAVSRMSLAQRRARARTTARPASPFLAGSDQYIAERRARVVAFTRSQSGTA